MKIVFTYLIYFFSFTTAASYAQSFEEYQQWKKSVLGEYSDYKDEVDREFSVFLKQKWGAFKTKEGKERDKKPKPKIIPKVTLLKTKAPLIKPIIQLPPPLKTITPIIKPQIIKAKNGEKITLPFLGYQLVFYVDLNKQFFLNSSINQNTILAGFNALAKSNYEPLIKDLKAARKQYHLNDWAYIQLVQKLSFRYSQQSANTANLMSWFLLVKSGLKTRISYAKNEIFLLSSTKQSLYDIIYFTYNQENYYVISKHKKVITPLYSYKAEYPKKLDAADFYFKNEILTKPHQQLMTFKFKFNRHLYKIDVPYNKNNIDFLATYPQMDLEYYFHAANSNSTTHHLIRQLKPLVKDMNQTKAVNFLLRFVQTAFKYATDGDQFGEENYLFLEETIYYPKSDCEDRAILFAWLVDNLLGIKVVGLNFPGHVAAAVLLDKPTGDTVNYKGKRYTISDPTYINANVGMKMPQYKKITPTIVPNLL